MATNFPPPKTTASTWLPSKNQLKWHRLSHDKNFTYLIPASGTFRQRRIFKSDGSGGCIGRLSSTCSGRRSSFYLGWGSAGYRDDYFYYTNQSKTQQLATLQQRFEVSLPDVPLVTFIGRLSTAKGIPFLLRAVKQLKPRANQSTRVKAFKLVLFSVSLIAVTV